MTSTPADHTVQLRPDIKQQRAPAFTIGDMACPIISDGEMLYPLDFLYPDAPQRELQAGVAGRLAEHGELPPSIPLSLSASVVCNPRVVSASVRRSSSP
jgi:hypothetical protein